MKKLFGIVFVGLVASFLATGKDIQASVSTVMHCTPMVGKSCYGAQVYCEATKEMVPASVQRGSGMCCGEHSHFSH